MSKQTKQTKKSKQPNWHRDVEWSPITGEKYYVWQTFYKGFYATVYPVGKKMGNKTTGFEYELYREHPLAEYDSLSESYSGTGHPDSEKARRWAINTINEWSN